MTFCIPLAFAFLTKQYVLCTPLCIGEKPTPLNCILPKYLFPQRWKEIGKLLNNNRSKKQTAHQWTTHSFRSKWSKSMWLQCICTRFIEVKMEIWIETKWRESSPMIIWPSIFSKIKRAWLLSLLDSAVSIPSNHALRIAYLSKRSSKNSLSMSSGDSYLRRQPMASNKTWNMPPTKTMSNWLEQKFLKSNEVLVRCLINYWAMP